MIHSARDWMSCFGFSQLILSPFRRAALGLALLCGFPVALGCTTTPPAVRFESVPLRASLAGEMNLNEAHPPLISLAEFQLFDRAPIEVMSREDAGAGLTGAEKVKIRLMDHGRVLTLKTKSFPKRLDGINNSPRRELAAYAIQSFFLDPADYVVPTTGVQCIPIKDWKQNNPGAPMVVVPGSACALMSYAFWLENVILPDVLFDEGRFLTDPLYAYHLANYNLLTYLVSHHDQRRGNVLISKNAADRRVFAIDNGVSFDPFFFNWFYPPTFMWREIKVPAVSRKAVNRLRMLEEKDLDVLRVVVQLEADHDGILRIEAPGVDIEEDEGVSVRGTTVQLGLTADEIGAIWERIENLLEDIEDGKIGLF